MKVGLAATFVGVPLLTNRLAEIPYKKYKSKIPKNEGDTYAGAYSEGKEQFRQPWEDRYKSYQRQQRENRSRQKYGFGGKRNINEPEKVKNIALSHIDDDNFASLQKNTINPVAIAATEKFKTLRRRSSPEELQFLKDVRNSADRSLSQTPEEFKNSKEYENIRLFIDKYDFNKKIKHIANFIQN